MGEHTLAWADEMIASDKDRALRRLQGLLSFKGKHSKAQINQAARKAYTCCKVGLEIFCLSGLRIRALTKANYY